LQISITPDIAVFRDRDIGDNGRAAAEKDDDSTSMLAQIRHPRKKSVREVKARQNSPVLCPI
jgi:hypothetical protein